MSPTRFTPARRIAGDLGAFQRPWWLAGGWAIDLFLDRETRSHTAIEVAILRRDLPALRQHLSEWKWFQIVQGVARPWDAADDAQPSELHARGPEGEHVEVLVQDADEATWRFRDPRVTLPLDRLAVPTKAGLAALAPEVVLLHKARAPGPNEEADFAAALPALDEARRKWLREALALVHPKHRWLAQLGG